MMAHLKQRGGSGDGGGELFHLRQHSNITEKIKDTTGKFESKYKIPNVSFIFT